MKRIKRSSNGYKSRDVGFTVLLSDRKDIMKKGGLVQEDDRVVITTESLGKEYKGMLGVVTSRKLLNDKYSIKLENGLEMAFSKDEFRHNSTNPKYVKGGSVKEGWGSEEEFELLYSLFPDNYTVAKQTWNSLTKEQKDGFISNLEQGDAAGEHIAESWLEFVNAKSEKDYWDNATNWDEMKEGGTVNSWSYTIGGL